MLLRKIKTEANRIMETELNLDLLLTTSDLFLILNLLSKFQPFLGLTSPTLYMFLLFPMKIINDRQADISGHVNQS
jgi:hypothetical protein